MGVLEGLPAGVMLALLNVNAVINSMVADVVASRILPMRRRELFLFLCFLGASLAFVRDYLFWSRLLVGLLELFVLPMLFWTCEVRFRALGAMLIFVARFVCEAASAAVWEVMTGGAPIGNAQIPDHLVAWFLTNILWCVIMWCLGLGMRWLLERLPIGRTSARPMGSLVSYVGLFALQMVFMWVLMFFCLLSLDDTTGFFVGLLPLSAMMVAVDVLLVRDSSRAEQASESMGAAAEAELLLEGYLAEMSRQSEKNAETAHLRHDLRNHLQVMDALLERGETDRAGAYALDVAGRLRAAVEADLQGESAGGMRP